MEAVTADGYSYNVAMYSSRFPITSNGPIDRLLLGRVTFKEGKRNRKTSRILNHHQKLLGLLGIIWGQKLWITACSHYGCLEDEKLRIGMLIFLTGTFQPYRVDDTICLAFIPTCKSSYVAIFRLKDPPTL